MFIYLLLLTMGPFFAPMAVADCRLDLHPPPLITYEQIKNKVLHNDIESTAELMPILPEALRANFVPFPKSHGIQPSSIRHPRMLFFSPDYELALAFATAEPSSVEVINFDRATGRNQSHLIKFDPKRKQAPIFFDDPIRQFAATDERNCARCHSSQSHFIWSPYPLWPGAFGQRAGSYGRSYEEAQALWRFQATASRIPELKYVPEISTISLGELESHRNVDVTTGLVRINARRIVNEIVTNPQFEERQASIFAALNRGVNFVDYLPAAEKLEYAATSTLRLQMIEARIRSEYKIINATFLFGTYADPNGHLLENAISHARDWDCLKFLMDKVGISMRDWFMSMRPNTFVAGNPTFGMGPEMRELLIEEFVRRDPKLKEEIEKSSDTAATFLLKRFHP